MQYQTKIEDNDVNIWTDGGTVEAVTLRSQTQMWTSGGGGYVGPNGGFVSPAERPIFDDRVQGSSFSRRRWLTAYD